MSLHNIIGSEAFQRRPVVYIRSLKAGGLRRRRARLAVAFAAGAAVSAAAALATLAVAFGPALTGG